MNDMYWGLPIERWSGSSVDLAMRFPVNTAEETLLETSKELWGMLDVIRGEQFTEVSGISAAGRAYNYNGFASGVIHLPLPSLSEEQLYAAKILISRGLYGKNWIGLCIPTGTLDGEIYCRDTIVDVNNPWVKDLYAWFAEIGQAIYRKHPFEVAEIGEEAWTNVGIRDILREGVPDPRGSSYLLPTNGELIYYPANWPCDE